MALSIAGGPTIQVVNEAIVDPGPKTQSQDRPVYNEAKVLIDFQALPVVKPGPRWASRLVMFPVPRESLGVYPPAMTCFSRDVKKDQILLSFPAKIAMSGLLPDC